MFKPKKTIYAKVTYADIAGLDSGAAKSGFAGPLLNQLAQMEGLIHVVRCFVMIMCHYPQAAWTRAATLLP